MLITDFNLYLLQKSPTNLEQQVLSSWETTKAIEVMIRGSLCSDFITAESVVSFTIVLRRRGKPRPLTRGASRTIRCGKPPLCNGSASESAYCLAVICFYNLANPWGLVKLR
ncbi:hypothetical protein H6G91_08810 [Nostoc muscorum FACHB-395]|nr:hypothetical protein [Desmonostoc muscorum FACHB-395]